MEEGILNVGQSAIVRPASGKGSHIGWLSKPASRVATFRVVVMTLVNVILSRCDGSLFNQTAPSQLVLRAVNLNWPSECNASDLEANDSPTGVETLPCGSSYIDKYADQTYEICASATDEACSSKRLERTSLRSVQW